MIKFLTATLLLLLLIFSAGCVNTEITEPGKIIPSIPAEANPPKTLEPIVGEWDGYDAGTKITYELTCLYSGYAKLEIEYNSAIPKQMYKLFGAWEKERDGYLLELSGGNYRFAVTENNRTGTLTIPDGTVVSMKYDSY